MGPFSLVEPGRTTDPMCLLVLRCALLGCISSTFGRNRECVSGVLVIDAIDTGESRFLAGLQEAVDMMVSMLSPDPSGGDSSRSMREARLAVEDSGSN